MHNKPQRLVGLALSGGGSRAIAFHLGCLRALHDAGVLKKISVVSSVSGGSVIAGMYAYRNDSFEEFDRRVLELLRNGLNSAALRHLFSPKLFMRIVATNLISRPIAATAKILKRQPPLNRWASRTDAFEGALQDILDDLRMEQVARLNLDVVINACELRTGTAFRFGNRVSGVWRFGEIEENRVNLAHAVACSVAYPIFLPAFDREYKFIKDGAGRHERVIVTDGGVYDNLGISCLEPGRDERFSLHVYPAEYIICCHAGYGQFTGDKIPYSFFSRTKASFESIFRKAQDSAMQRLHMHKKDNKIRGFLLPYLGQQDSGLPFHPSDLVRRDEVVSYPTDFSSMSEKNIDLLTRRGEQLTSMLLGYYCPEL